MSDDFTYPDDLFAPSPSEPAGLDDPLSDLSALPEERESLPAEASDAWWLDQLENGLCVPASVTMVVNEITGQSYSLDQVKSLAADAGMLKGTDGNWQGMTAADGAALMNALGVEATPIYDQGIHDLDRWLNDEGRDVLLGVDADEVWYVGSDDREDAGMGANHMLRIADIDLERDATGTLDGVASTVTLQDPGNPEGRGFVMTVDDFKDAWKDSGNEAIVTGSSSEGELSGPSASKPDGNVATSPAEERSPTTFDLPSLPGTPVAGMPASAAIIALVVKQAASRIRPQPAF